MRSNSISFKLLCNPKTETKAAEPTSTPRRRSSRITRKSTRPTSTPHQTPISAPISNPSTTSNVPSTNYSSGSSNTSMSSSTTTTTTRTVCSSISLSSLRDSLPEKPDVYDFAEIRSATNNFLAKRYSSSSSPSWRCNLRGKDVIVFQRKFRRWIEKSELREKLAVICRSHYSAIIKLRGASISDNHIYLVYQTVNGSNLAECLRNPKNPNFTVLSTWMSRMQIATDLAHGLDYIHNYTGLSMNLVHKHIKSSGIIVTEPSFNARICHFGTAELCGETAIERPSGSDLIVEETPSDDSRALQFEGVSGYMSPEFQSTGVATQKSDVYAFGVVILELLSGEEPVKFIFDRESGDYRKISVIETARNAIDGGESGGAGGGGEGSLRRWLDRRLKESFPVDVAEKVTRVALECVHVDPDKRPGMASVACKISKLYLDSQNWSDRVNVEECRRTNVGGASEKRVGVRDEVDIVVFSGHRSVWGKSDGERDLGDDIVSILEDIEVDSPTRVSHRRGKYAVVEDSSDYDSRDDTKSNEPADKEERDVVGLPVVEQATKQVVSSIVLSVGDMVPGILSSVREVAPVLGGFSTFSDSGSSSFGIVSKGMTSSFGSTFGPTGAITGSLFGDTSRGTTSSFGSSQGPTSEVAGSSFGVVSRGKSSSFGSTQGTVSAVAGSIFGFVSRGMTPSFESIQGPMNAVAEICGVVLGRGDREIGLNEVNSSTLIPSCGLPSTLIPSDELPYSGAPSVGVTLSTLVSSGGLPFSSAPSVGVTLSSMVCSDGLPSFGAPSVGVVDVLENPLNKSLLVPMVLPVTFGNGSGWRGLSCDNSEGVLLEMVYRDYPRTLLPLVKLSSRFNTFFCTTLAGLLRSMKETRITDLTLQTIVGFETSIRDLRRTAGMDLDWLEAHVAMLGSRRRLLDMEAQEVGLHGRETVIQVELLELKTKMIALLVEFDRVKKDLEAIRVIRAEIRSSCHGAITSDHYAIDGLFSDGTAFP